eukprot:2076934-Rhodomonas_salina.1
MMRAAQVAESQRAAGASVQSQEPSVFRDTASEISPQNAAATQHTHRVQPTAQRVCSQVSHGCARPVQMTA